jgi:hypothetical protein
MTTRCAWILGAAAAVVACGSSSQQAGVAPPGSTTVAGMVGQQQTMALQDATALVGPIDVNGRTAQEADVVMTNVVGACGFLQQKGNPASLASLLIVVAGLSSIAPGVYSVSSTGSSQVQYFAQDANCVTTVSEAAVSGTISYNTITSSMIEGSVDVTFASGDHFSGNFMAPICSVSLDSIVSAGMMTTACMHPG